MLSRLRYSIYIFLYCALFVFCWENVGGFQFFSGINEMTYIYGLDGFSLWFLELTAFLVPVCFLASLGSC